MMGKAIDYMLDIGRDKIQLYENELLEYATLRMRQIDGIRIIGTAPQKASVLKFCSGWYTPA